MSNMQNYKCDLRVLLLTGLVLLIMADLTFKATGPHHIVYFFAIEDLFEKCYDGSMI